MLRDTGQWSKILLVTSDYHATSEDFQAIELALRAVWNPKLDFVFRNRTALKKTVIASYDSKYVYLWSQTKQPDLESISYNVSSYFAYRIPHKLIIPNEHHSAWCAGIRQKEIEDLLPSSIKNQTRFNIPRISGGLLTPFTALQKAKEFPFNPYTTRESYLSTIVHEFGHIYWNQFKLWWMSDKTQNLRLLRYALDLHSHIPIGRHPNLYLPVTGAVGEIFAFCTEYFTSSIFWPKHQKALDKFIAHTIEELIKQEESKNLDREDSVIELNKNPHNFASVYGKIVLSLYPTTWPQFLTQLQPLGFG